MYFASNKKILKNDFLSRYTDALKYNECGTCIISKSKPKFFDSNDINNIDKIDKYLSRAKQNELLFNKTLLISNYEEENNDFIKDYRKIIAKHHVIVLN